MEADVVKELAHAMRLIAGCQKSLLTSEEAAEYIGCAPSTLRDMARKREIPHYKDRRGHLLRFRRDDLDAWMMHLRVDTQQELDDAATRYALGYKTTKS